MAINDHHDHQDSDMLPLDNTPMMQPRPPDVSQSRRNTAIDRRRDPPSAFTIEDQLTIRELYSVIHNLELQLHEMNRRINEIKSAFVSNDLKKPDYDGHRKEHLDAKATKEAIEGYKTEITKKILGGVLTFLVGILTGKLSGWI